MGCLPALLPISAVEEQLAHPVLDYQGFDLYVPLKAPGISAFPSEENMRYINVMILGPTQSPCEGVFKLELFLPENIQWLYQSFQALLSAPNPDDPLSDNIAKRWKANEAEAVATGSKSESF